MHGDNSGYYEAFRLMAVLHRRVGDPAAADAWDARAEALRDDGQPPVLERAVLHALREADAGDDSGRRRGRAS